MDLENKILKGEPLKPAGCKRETDEQELFNFPYKPYDIQLNLMRVAYDNFEESKFALLESPTGTGKSLSLICSAFTWLIDHQNKVKQNLKAKKTQLTDKIAVLKKEEEESGDWLSMQTKRQDFNKELVEITQELDKIIKIEQKKEARRHAKLHHIPLENYSSISSKARVSSDDPNRDDNDENINEKLLGQNESQMIEELDDDDDIEKKIEENNEDDYVRPKIYYASRTHSQLSQFINEIKKTKFANMDVGTPIKVAPLASRANLCVNSQVLKLRDSSAINERCMEMQRETKAEKKCPYIKAKQVNMLKEDILSSVQDIEDIVSRGRVIGSCPYYATRMAIPEAEVVVLPYNNLLHHDTRQASSLDLKDSIVIVDEAHNILETICSIHSSPISGHQLIGSHTILSRYYKKFLNMMSPRNAETIKSVIQCLTALIRFLDEPKRHLNDYECPKAINVDEDEQKSDNNVVIPIEKNGNKAQARHEELMIDAIKFIGAAKIERFNVFKLIDYFNRSRLARKLLGFYRQDNTIDLSLELYNLVRKDSNNVSKLREDNNDTKSPARKKRKVIDKQQVISEKLTDSQKMEQTNLAFLRNSNPGLDKPDTALNSYPVYTLVEFLKSLTNLAHDGKVLVDHVEHNIQQSILKFILLNPSSQFKHMAIDARSIVLAGGTMQPFNEFIDLLFAPLGIKRDRLTLFSCGHVVGPDQLYVSSLSHGSTGKPLELSFKTRSSFETIDEIGRTVSNLTSVVPGGMVCFLPSYDYEQICFNRWTQIGVIRNIETKCKQVFREPRQTSHLKPVLDEYSRVIEKGKTSGRGALLLCVVGGKMSEGINFNDDLGRCVVMVGLPYANIKSAELQQKMSYYDRTCKMDREQSSEGLQASAGQQYYENLCLKGINQSIGRAIRHKNDYASIILLDRRYSSKSSIKNGLPEWIRHSLVEYDKFGTMFSKLKAFYTKVALRERQE